MSLTQAIALSPYQMLSNAVGVHMRKHRGQKPRCFVLHPNVWLSVLGSPECRNHYAADITCEKFGGVPVLQSLGQSVPVMVDCLGVAQEL